MRLSFLPALALAFFCALLVLAAPDRAEALMGVGRQAVGAAEDGQLVEEAASRNKRVTQRRANRRLYYTHRGARYAPYFCSRPHQYYYWQWWPPVCYPL